MSMPHLREVPRDGLALAVGVGGQDDVVPVLDRLLERADRFLAVAHDPVARPEVVLDVHGQLSLGEVADVPHRSAHVEAISEEALQRPRLGG
jgi:hypothetical protein